MKIFLPTLVFLIAAFTTPHLLAIDCDDAIAFAPISSNSFKTSAVLRTHVLKKLEKDFDDLNCPLPVLPESQSDSAFDILGQTRLFFRNLEHLSDDQIRFVRNETKADHILQAEWTEGHQLSIKIYYIRKDDSLKTIYKSQVWLSLQEVEKLKHRSGLDWLTLMVPNAVTFGFTSTSVYNSSRVPEYQDFSSKRRSILPPCFRRLQSAGLSMLKVIDSLTMLSRFFPVVFSLRLIKLIPSRI